MYWDTLRKTYILVHVSYGYANATLFAENIRVRAGDPFDVSVDLNKNLRTRHKGVGTYVDASDLARGEMSTLKTLRIDDDQIIDRIGRHLEHVDENPKTWRLHVALEGSHWFVVRPEVRGPHESLWLHIESTAEVSPLDSPPDSRN